MAAGRSTPEADERASLWLRALPALDITAGASVLAVAMSREPALRAMLAAGVAVSALDWHVAAVERAVAAGLPRACVLPWDGSRPPVAADVATVDLGRLAGWSAFALAVSAAVRALRPGGRLLVCGGNADGIGGGTRRLREWFPAVEARAYGGGRRILECRAPAVAEIAVPGGDGPVAVNLGGRGLRMHAADGVFARGLPDAATERLVDAALPRRPEDAPRRACDVGCGGGAAGLALLLAGAGRCAFVDENLLALAAARRNAELNGLLPRADFLAVDAAAAVPGGPYELVVCNPPFHDGPAREPALGRAVVGAAWRAVAPRGRLFVVGHRFLRYEQEVPALREVWGDGTFRVLAATRAPDRPDGRSGARRREP